MCKMRKPSTFEIEKENNNKGKKKQVIPSTFVVDILNEYEKAACFSS